MEREQYEKVADFLHDIGWRSSGDAQWSQLRDKLPELKALLSTTDTRDSLQSVINDMRERATMAIPPLSQQVGALLILHWADRLTALQAGAGDARLTKPARVGCTSFNEGVNERLVIECAQRNYEYWKNPPDIDTEGLAKLFGVHPVADKKDGARYRYLISGQNSKREYRMIVNTINKPIRKEKLDEAIDAAIDNAQTTEGK